MKLKACYALLGIALSGAAHADVKYTETMTMSGKSGAGAPASRSTTYLKAGLQRTDQTMNMGPVSMSMISVSSCPAKRSMRFDPALKLYTSSPLFGETKKTDDKTPEAKPAPAPKPDKTNGKITMSADVKMLGTEEVAGRKARHYLIDQKITPEGCAGKTPTNFKMEIWVADYDMPAFACRSPWMANAASAPAAGGCSITTEFKGDQAALAEAYRGLIVKRKMIMGDTVMTYQLTELSEAKLDDALFTPGADWKLVSDAEFDKKRQAEMMRGMMSGAGAGDGAAGGDDGKTATATAAPPDAGGDAGTMGEVKVEDGKAGDGKAPPADDDKKKEGDGNGGNPGGEVAKETGKQKLKKKFKLPF